MSFACSTEMFPSQRQIPLSLKARLTVPQIRQSKQLGLTCPFGQSQGHLGWVMGLGLLAPALEAKREFKAEAEDFHLQPAWLAFPQSSLEDILAGDVPGGIIPGVPSLSVLASPVHSLAQGG